jgi:hypothetical protein
MIVHPRTGEVIEDLSELTDGQLAELVAIFEEENREARERFYEVRKSLIGRMLDQKATLVLADGLKVRLRRSTRVKENKEAKELLRQLSLEVPAQFRKGFGTEVTATVSVLKEIRKMGGEWSEKVKSLLDESEYLLIEPIEESSSNEAAFRVEVSSR